MWIISEKNKSACYNRIWSWSPMPCEKHGPRASVTAKNSAFGLGFCLRSPSGHVFHTAGETMIKSYNMTPWTLPMRQWATKPWISGNMIKQKTWKFCVNNKKKFEDKSKWFGQPGNDSGEPVFHHGWSNGWPMNLVLSTAQIFYSNLWTLSWHLGLAIGSARHIRWISEHCRRKETCFVQPLDVGALFWYCESSSGCLLSLLGDTSHDTWELNQCFCDNHNPQFGPWILGALTQLLFLALLLT